MKRVIHKIEILSVFGANDNFEVTLWKSRIQKRKMGIIYDGAQKDYTFRDAREIELIYLLRESYLLTRTRIRSI